MQYIRKSGMMLLEIVVFLMIIAIIFGKLGWFELSVFDRHALSVTRNNLDTIKNALLVYHKKTGVLPCPAYFDPNARSTHYGVGVNNCHTIQPTDTNFCGAGLLDCDSQVLIGALPFMDLEISKNAAVDGWGNGITYAIDKRFTNNFVSARGSIVVIDFAGNTISHNIVGGVVFLLISHGSNGAGAYSTKYETQKACSASSAKDHENCNGDKIFRYNVDDSPDSNFDDVLLWGSKMYFF